MASPPTPAVTAQRAITGASSISVSPSPSSLRKVALELALAGHAGDDANSIVERAETFLAFLATD